MAVAEAGCGCTVDRQKLRADRDDGEPLAGCSHRWQRRPFLRAQIQRFHLGERARSALTADGYQPVLARNGPVDDKRFPRETVAEILVVEPRESIAIGIVTHSDKEARIGDRIEARKGF